MPINLREVLLHVRAQHCFDDLLSELRPHCALLADALEEVEGFVLEQAESGSLHRQVSGKSCENC